MEIRYRYICEKIFFGGWEDPYQFLLDEFSSQGRSFLFDKFITHFNLPYEVADLLDLFRYYEDAPDSLLTVFPWFRRLSDRLNQSFPLLLITNGNKAQQKQKIEELNLVKFFPNIHCVFADEYGGKPKKAPLKALAKKIVLHDPIYIGDSEVDRVFCEKCEIEFVNVKNLMA